MDIAARRTQSLARDCWLPRTQPPHVGETEDRKLSRRGFGAAEEKAGARSKDE